EGVSIKIDPALPQVKLLPKPGQSVCLVQLLRRLPRCVKGEFHS
ncbi:hypothetical protein HMPREF9374_0756, partial [Desmospora sp. 8437]